MKTSNARKSKVTVEVKQHPFYPETHWIGVVTTARGYCYFCTWADQPTEETVLQAWTEDRKAFDPYRS